MPIAFFDINIRTRPQVKFASVLLAFAMGLTPGVAPGTASPAGPAVAKAEVPPYHAHSPRGPLPQVLPWREFASNPWAANAYRMAAQIRPVLYQLPCYCGCNRELGHTCLLDCFTRADKHASICDTCMKEAIFAYQRTMEGVNARTIRAEIMKGKWTKVDLAQYHQMPR